VESGRRYFEACWNRRLRCVKPISRSLPIIALICATLLAEPARADAWLLFQNLIRSGPIEVQVPEGELAERCRVAAQNLSARTNLEAIVLAPGDAPNPSRPRIVMGNFETPGIEPLLEALKLTRLENGGFKYSGKGYVLKGDSLVAWFEDPERPGLPLALYFSQDINDLIPYVTDLMPPSNPAVICYQSGDIVFEGKLLVNGKRVAQSELSSWGQVKNYLSKSTSDWNLKSKSYLPPGIDEARRSDYVSRAWQARVRAEGLLGTENGRLGLRLFFHAHLEDLYEITHRRALSVANFFTPGAHVLLAPGVPDDGGSAVIEAYAQKMLGPPAADWMREGLSVLAADSWWGRALDDHLARLAYAGIAPSIAELIDPAADLNYSEHLRAPLRALLFKLAVANTEGLRGADLWTGERPFVVNSELEAAFATHLETAAAAFVAPKLSIELNDYRSGFALEAEQETGARVRPGTFGYGSRGSDRVIEELHGFGANSVVLSTRAFMENEWPARPDAPIDFRRKATSSDAAIASATGKAQQLSMRVLLQPHLITSASGNLGGRKSWSGANSFERLFVEYERFVEHYALLADLLGCEIFCLGTSLKAAMDFVPDPKRKNVNLDAFQEKRERWRSIFVRARNCFSGGLTYAVRSAPHDFAMNSFQLWELFDFVSAELFQPLQSGTSSGRTERSRLERQILSMTKFAESVELPLLILSVGFPATDQSAFKPSEPGYAAKDAVMGGQAKLYEVLGQVLNDLRDDPALVGTYLWSVSTNPLRRGTTDPGYTPLGKPSEEWLPAIFRR
jgi:hypothetical protein